MINDKHSVVRLSMLLNNTLHISAVLMKHSVTGYEYCMSLMNQKIRRSEKDVYFCFLFFKVDVSVYPFYVCVCLVFVCVPVVFVKSEAPAVCSSQSVMLRLSHC